MATNYTSATNKNGKRYNVYDDERNNRVNIYAENGADQYRSNLAAYGLSSKKSYPQNPNEPGVKPSFNWSGVKPTYSSSYSSQIQGLLNQILNKEKFSYNYTSDPLYEQ